MRALLLDLDGNHSESCVALRCRGQLVRHAESCDAAAAILREHSIDLVLIARWVDTEAAATMLARLREVPNGATPMFAVLVPSNCKDSVAELLNIGADELLPLPLNSSVAMERLATIETRIHQHQQHEKYHSIFENAVEGIFQTTPGGRYLDVNPALARIYGYSSPQALIAGLTDIAHQLYVQPGRREEFVAILRKDDSVENFESQVFRADGRVIWITENARAVRDRAGRVIYFEGTVEDITEHKRTAEQLRLMESAVLHAHDAVLIAQAPENPGQALRTVSINQAFTKQTGYSAAEILGRSPIICNGPRTDARQLRRIEDALADAKPVRAELLQYRKDGTEYWADIHFAPIYDSYGQASHFVCLQRDATDRKRTEEALRESEERYALAALGANDGLWDWDLRTDHVYYAPRWRMLLGLENTELTDSPDEWFSRVHPSDGDALRTQLDEHLAGKSQAFRCEFRMRHSDGTYRWMISRGVAVRDDNGKPLRMAGSQTDISARKLAELQLKHDAYHDALTGLPNRALLMDRLRQSIHRGKRRPDYRFVLLFLDLDRFKVINDSLGHQAGDHLLIAIARRLETCLRPSDSVARLGGDEFVILLDDLRDVKVDAVAARIQKELSVAFQIENREVFISASIGITVGNPEVDRAEDLLREADTAMYRAKSAGKNRHETYQTSMHLQAVSTLHMDTNLRHAIERQEFFLEYQPILSLQSMNILGFEALIRWRHPHRGIVSPAEFIPLAEETGLITQITEWVLNAACAQLNEWTAGQTAPQPITMSVNISARCCSDARLAAQIEKTLKESGIPPRSLKLEITEGSIVARNTESSAFFELLKKLDVGLMIDDFGTGYSSLSYLHRISAEAIKIDRSFVRDMMTAEKNLEIIRAVIALARSLKMSVIAEGVETTSQLALLRELCCDSAQGFLFSRPVDAATCARLMEHGLDGFTERKLPGTY